MSEYRFITPVDVLYLRGNQLFGGAGDHAPALMPPWPSLLAGAIRSRMLVDQGIDLGRLTDRTTVLEPQGLSQVLGTPAEPGAFRITSLAIADREGQIYHRLPADLSACEKDGKLKIHRLVPVQLSEKFEIGYSGCLKMPPFPRPAMANKPESGYWISEPGLKSWLEGEIPKVETLVEQGALWKTDSRLGIARSRHTGTAETGKIYTTDTVAMKSGVGFLAGVDGCPKELLPAEGLLRLGGDGRGASIARWEGLTPEENTARAGEPFTLLLDTPGLFPGGWLPVGVDFGTMMLEIDGLRCRLVSAVTPRPVTVSGWDIAAHRPKPAQQAVPAGSVYFFDEVEGDPASYLDIFWRLVEEELGPHRNTVWKQRRAEGFNAIRLGRWPGAGS